MPSNPPYLIRSRHGLWYFRLVVPEPLRTSVGKREIRRSLGTRNKREAFLGAAQALIEARQMLDNAGSGSSLQSCPSKSPSKSIHTPISKTLPKLSDLISSYRKYQLLEGVSIKTLDDKDSVTKLLIRVAGDKNISYYTVGDAKTFRDTALKLPPLATRTLKKYPSKTPYKDHC
ncbi:DUF6538 domain-containing protein [Halomonas sp. V046]|uniref:DUF6538 domain-containing protein n=1 Tax=Halomonas sp. V046 TaxID=3459611 RepID=UPI004044CB15